MTHWKLVVCPHRQSVAESRWFSQVFQSFVSLELTELLLVVVIWEMFLDSPIKVGKRLPFSVSSHAAVLVLVLWKWFTRFHQDLGSLSCLRSPTFRGAVEHLVSRVSPDEFRAVFMVYLLKLYSHWCPHPDFWMRILVTGIHPLTTLRRSPILFPVHRRWLDSGVFSLLIHSIAEGNSFLNLFD